MTSKNLAIITLTAASLAFGQFKLPKVSDVKDKLPSKGAAAAKSADPTTPTAPVDSQPATANANPTSLPAGTVKGSYKGLGIELTLCEKTASEGQYDVACAAPARTLKFKGSVTNVFATLRFNPPWTNASPRFTVQIFKDGALDEHRDVTVSFGGRTGIAEFTKATRNN